MLPGHFCNTRQSYFYGKVTKSCCGGHKLGGIKGGLGKKNAKSPLLFTQFMATTARLGNFTIKVTLSSIAKATG